jgi:hypothetical protein
MTTTANLPNGLTVSVDNILRVFRAATARDEIEGMRWYGTARDLCFDLAKANGITLEQCAGIFAALSPRTRWGQNVMLAERCIRDNGIMVGTLGASMRAATRIAHGEMPLDVLSGTKVRAFYTCIIEPLNEDNVVIDAHALSIAAGRSLGNKEQAVLKRAGIYDIIAGLYKEAAEILGFLPIEVQAITWVAWRNLPASTRKGN